jgi:flagellar biosynthesis/type III secretory pathway protein FliH
MTALTIVLAIAALLWARRRFSVRMSARTRSVGLVAAILALQVVLGAPAAHAQSCNEAPNPERPGAGMVGALDPPVGNGLPGSPYLDYGYAGMVWHYYQTNCSIVPNANATLDTWAGNELFSIGKNIVGATNALHYTVMGRGLLVPLDDAVKNGVQKVYDNVYLRWFGLVALILAILMFRQIWTGDFATISKRGLWALAAMWLATSTLALPQFYNLLDNTLVSKTSEIQAGFIEAPEEQGTLHVLPTKLHDAVVYQSWLRGAFGTPEAPQATEFGPRILKAQAWTTAEIAEHKDADQAALQAKKNEWIALEKQLGTAKGYFDGTDGSRTGAGFLALLQSIAFSLFQLFAKAAVLLAQLLLRILTLAGPLIGLVALIHHDLLRKVARAAAVTVFNVLVLAVLAGVHALLLQAIFNATGLSLLTRTLLGLMLTLVCFVIGKPLRRMWQMVEMSVGSAGNVLPMSGGIWSKMMGRKKPGPSPQDEFWESVRENDADGEEVPQRGRGRVRPEASSPVMATAQRLDRDAQPGQIVSGGDGYGVRAGALPAGSGPAALPVARSRVVDSPPVTDRQWDRVDDAVLVPSRSNGYSGPVQEPRRAETEVVAGRQVHVIYRPSRGFEVRDN